MTNNTLTYFLRDNGACGYYRQTLPLRSLGKHFPEWRVQSIEPGEPAGRFEAKLESADVIVAPRLHDWDMYHAMKQIKRYHKKKIVLDFDDDLFRISPMSSHYEELGIADVVMTLKDGTTHILWEDGKHGFDIQRNLAAHEAIRAGLELADGVIVTTERLAAAYQPHNRNVFIAPNCLDLSKWAKLPLRPRETLRLGWHGGSSHYEDLAEIASVLPQIMDEFPNLTVVFMGMAFAGIVKALDPKRVEFHPWIETPAFPYKLAILDLDVAMIPLRDTPFNQAKSPIKWIEYAALEVPAVTSAIPPYTEVFEQGNGVYIEDNDHAAWLAGLRLLLSDPLLRATMGRRARDTVEARFSIDTQVWRWNEILTEILTGERMVAV